MKLFLSKLHFVQLKSWGAPRARKIISLCLCEGRRAESSPQARSRSRLRCSDCLYAVTIEAVASRSSAMNAGETKLAGP